MRAAQLLFTAVTMESVRKKCLLPAENQFAFSIRLFSTFEQCLNAIGYNTIHLIFLIKRLFNS